MQGVLPGTCTKKNKSSQDMEQESQLGIGLFQYIYVLLRIAHPNFFFTIKGTTSEFDKLYII